MRTSAGGMGKMASCGGVREITLCGVCGVCVCGVCVYIYIYMV